MFGRIAIVNRGEAAMRLINAVRELRYERRVDLRTVALHVAAERSAMFVREADEAVCIDTDRDPGAGSPYLDIETLGTALLAARADAAWVGWGFVAERPEFADLCGDLGVVFIGPRPDVIRALGDKIGAKRLAERADVPVAAWSGGPVDSLTEAVAAGERIGYPLMVKATAGGGGRGIRRVERADAVAEAFASARAEGAKAFGDPTVFMERVVTDARHVEVQIIGDHHGTTWAVGVRDCSLQRRHQKVIEESHCLALTPQQDADLRASAVRLARLAEYTNAGTVEFLYQPAERRFSFLEVNTRLQVEHPITEQTNGLDLVKLQILVASGEALSGDAPSTASTTGYAIEARLNAEDPDRGFAPAPGTIETLVLPAGPGIRVDTGVAEGDVIPPEFDSMIAKIIATGCDRDEALGRLHRALSQTVVVVRGGTTNKSFLLGLLDHPVVRDGTVDTGWLDRLTAADGHLTSRNADIALVAAALDASAESERVRRRRFLAWASRGRPIVDGDGDGGHVIELRHGATPYRVTVREIGPSRFAVGFDDSRAVVRSESLGRARSRLAIDGAPDAASHSILSSIQDTDHLVEVDGVVHRFSRDDAGMVRASATALVVAVDVEPGTVVDVGDRLLVVEAMKMEIAITAPLAGRVVDVLVTRNVQVDAGAPLVRIEQLADHEAGTAAPSTARLTLADGLPRERPDPQAVEAYLLGFDVTLDEARAALGSTTPEDEVALVELFADLCALAPERRGEDAGAPPHEHFNAFLRSLDAEREGLPSWYVDRLLRALGHYRVTSLDPSPDLERALLRMFTSQQRLPEEAGVVMDVLERRLATGDEAGPPPALAGALDRLIEAAQRRFPTLTSIARGARHHFFDRPLFEHREAQVAAEMRDELERLDRLAPGPERDRHLARLVASPLPLMGVLNEHGRLATTTHPGTTLEVLTRRDYKIRTLDDVRVETLADGSEAVRASYTRGDRTVDVLAVRALPNGIATTLTTVASTLAAVGDGTSGPPLTAVVDLYVALGGDAGEGALDLDDPEALGAWFAAVVDAAALPSHVTRVAVVVAAPLRRAEVPIFTYRRAGREGVQPYWMLDAAAPDAFSAGGFTEDVTFRGLHPMIARRLQMWRLSNFEISRLGSPDGVFVFDCIARTNPSDERLIAVAEIRDVTPVRGDDGRVLSLPGVETVLISCLEGIRRNLAGRPDAARLEWNRVMLYIWPVVDFSVDEMRDIARRLAPLTEGLGLEQVVVSGRLLVPGGERPVDAVLRLGYEAGRGLTVRFTEPPDQPMLPLDDYTRKLIQTRRRGLVYPYELVPLLAGSGGTFVEYDLDDSGALAAVDRERGRNRAGLVVGVARTPTERYPIVEGAGGITRVALLGDPTKAMGSITEAECRRVLAAIDLAAELGVPIEWFALSAGARIAMDSGSENLDWVARVLRRLVEHTQAGGEVNVVVAGINVGAQPYWNAEATMLMHTRGILVMTPDSAMVLTGKQAIDYSGGVSAEDNLGIGGYGRVMGPNGEAQYFAPTVAAATRLLFDHYDLTYRAPGERWPRRAATSDPVDRDVRAAEHRAEGTDFTTVGDVFGLDTNRERKRPFDMRTMMRAVADADHVPLERWPDMAEAETAVVWDARLGGHAVSLLGVESRPLPRYGRTPADGPTQWSAGTLFPLSSKKLARAINAATGSRPVVMLANLSGFDGSPESLRRLQLEYGAEIGRAIVNFDGPFVLCVVSRYHGGAFVVFSATLNDDMEVLAVEGSFASVIGGAPAAAVVFTRDVDARTRDDPRLRVAEAALAGATGDDAARRRAALAELRETVRNEKLGEVAAEFDAIHSVERARAVGSVHRIIAAADLRAELIAAVERGLARVEGRG